MEDVLMVLKYSHYKVVGGASRRGRVVSEWRWVVWAGVGRLLHSVDQSKSINNH